MPRLVRLEGPGALHHIMIPGDERHSLFKGEKDREVPYFDLAAALSVNGRLSSKECCFGFPNFPFSESSTERDSPSIWTATALMAKKSRIARGPSEIEFNKPGSALASPVLSRITG